MIDPTRPVEKRNHKGELLDANDHTIPDERGKPITRIFHSRAVAQFDREPNREAIKRYPILSDNDLILSCKPNSFDMNRKQRELKCARAYWRDLEKRKIVAIIEEKDGWRIVPSERHMAAYRGLKQAIKKGETIY